MAYFEFHDTLPDHPKTATLTRMLRRPLAQVVGHLSMMLAWLVRYRPGGAADPTHLERGARWTGKRGHWIKACVTSGFIDLQDGLAFVHDWASYTKGYRRQQQEAERMRAKRANRTPNVGDVLQSVGRSGAEQNRAEQNRAESPSPTHDAPPSDAGRVARTPPPGKNLNIELLVKRAQAAQVPNNPETLRRYLAAWSARAGAARVEEVLMMPQAKGLNVLQLDKGFFNGDAPGGKRWNYRGEEVK